MSTYEKLSLFLETAVVFILIVEFIYDAIWNSRENRIKRRKANAKSKERVVAVPKDTSSPSQHLAIQPDAQGSDKMRSTGREL